ncbi:MAG: SMP-30/gluconolactonase/LRE family protein, partial [Gammaproteobacteria bacterium]
MQEIIAHRIASGLVFGEGIRWYGASIVLSDMLGKRVVNVDVTSGEVTTVVEIDTQPNGLIVRDDGSLLINSMFDCKLLEFNAGKLSTYADLSSIATGYLGD